MKSIASSLLTAAAAALVAGSAFAAAPAASAKPDLAKGEAAFGAVCAACHAADGNSTTPANPKLAQQHPQYLVKQLQEFKSGKRNNAIMKGFASTLSDEDLLGFNVDHLIEAGHIAPSKKAAKAEPTQED